MNMDNLGCNKLTNFRYIPYNCISYLIENGNDMWKLLKYNDVDAWRKPSLTAEEKSSLIYKGVPPQDDYCVFFDEGQVDAWTKQVTMLRVVPIKAEPSKYTIADVYIGFEVLSHYEINHLSNYTTRVDSIMEELVTLLNGTNIDGVGTLYFDEESFPDTALALSGQKPYSGKILIMGLNYARTQ